MRSKRLAKTLAPALALLVALVLPAARPALAKKPAPAQQEAPAGEPAEISGRIVAGLDKVFIKDAQGFCLVQGQELAPYSGRHVQAKGLLRQEGGERMLRLTSYRVQSPDDDSPGAGGEVRAGQAQGPDKGKKAKR